MSRTEPGKTVNAPPAVIGDRYRVERLIARGGMGTVYLCRDTQTTSRVAVKVLREDVSSVVVVERFLREIEFASNLSHPQIPKVLDSGMHGDLPFYVMTFVEGESLRSRLDREKQLPISEAVRITAAVAEPAEYAHRQGIIHRDIKPDNILLAGNDVYVLDFGIARAIIESATDRLTSTGVAVGTPAYMSPEQALSEGTLDSRSDIYSLACVTYEMIAGIPPFVGATAQAVMARRFVAKPPPLGESRDGVPEHIEQAVSTALSRAPADRFQSIAEFSNALKLQDTGRSLGASMRVVRRRLIARKRLLAIGLGFPVFAALVISGLILFSRWRDGPGTSSVPDPRRIAVLYFDDHSADGSLDYLANGLTESLIHELSAVRAIDVVSRNGVKPFRERSVPLDSIAAKLRVGSVVEGSLQRSGDRVRVTAQLINPLTGSQLESATIERQMADLFHLEDDLAHEVASMLRRRIGRDIMMRETIKSTSNNLARDMVFRADNVRDEAVLPLASSDSVTRDTGIRLLLRADTLLAAAEAADPKWLEPVVRRGWVALDAALRQGGGSRDRSFLRAWAHAQRAVSRKTDAPGPLELRGTTLYYRATRVPISDSGYNQILRRAASDLERAVTLDSSLATAWGTLGRIRFIQGDLAAAEYNANKALEADAYLRDAPDVLATLYGATLLRNKMTEAWTWCLRGREDFRSDPRFVECQLTLLADDVLRAPDPARAWALVKEGDRLDPPADARRVGRPFLPYYRMILAAAVSARAGQGATARTAAARARAAVSNDEELVLDLMYEDAYVDLLLGNRKSAVDKLSAYHAARPSTHKLTRQLNRWKPLMSDTAFTNMLDRAASLSGG